MEEQLNCKECSQIFTVSRTGLKASNGSWERFYSCGVKCLTTSKCYFCMRKTRNDKWPSIKQQYNKYEKTKKGYLMRCYRNMKSRVTGIQWRKKHLYQGKDILTKEDFYNWSLGDESFNRLFKQWEELGKPPRKGPSIDRIDNSLGYIPGNIQWVTFSENCRRGALSKNSGIAQLD